MTMALRREMVAEARKVDGEDRVRTFVVNNDQVDRYNSIIKPEGGEFSNYRKLPTVLVQHGFAFDGMPVARTKALRVVGGTTEADLEFLPVSVAPEADRMLGLVDAGVLATSIRMAPLEVEYDASRETGDEWADWLNPPVNFLRWELLEISLVNLPGNADALLKRSSTLPEDQARALTAVLSRGSGHVEMKPPFTRAELAEMKTAAAKRSAPAPAPAEQPAADEVELSPEQLSALVAEVTDECIKEERAAIEARRTGNTARSTEEHAP